MEAQREKARAKSTFEAAEGGPAFTFASDDALQRSSASAIASRATTSTELNDAPVLAVFDEARQEVDALAAGQRFVVARPHAVLPRSRRPGLGRGPASSADGDGEAAR